MEPVSALNRIIELLRQQVGEARASGQRAERYRPPHRLPSPARPSKEALRRQIARSLAQTGAAADPATARHVFLSSVLAWEFGPDILQDERLAPLITRLEQLIDEQPPLARRLELLLRQLSG